MTPKDNPAMTEFSTEKAARSSVPTWPAKVWVMAPSEYWHTEVKMAGPAKYHSLFDSAMNSLQNGPSPVIGEMSPPSTTEEWFDAKWSRTGGPGSWCSRRGCLAECSIFFQENMSALWNRAERLQLLTSCTINFLWGLWFNQKNILWDIRSSNLISWGVFLSA